ncbi:ABC transporter substrate-binding protein [Okeanomitos corallinicola TIOX110]|uniref:ABC transporter substrate-binding protein n=1 Tax=Okeanomitos corallinicola TIOX110 TaxID=3133117 RepID=A0ABZ2UTW0_9CYAN
MGKRVIFEIGEGNFEQGFPVKIRIGEEGKLHFAEINGNLPAFPELPQVYYQWQSAYNKLPGNWLITVPDAQITNVSTSEICHQAANKFLTSFNNWLNQKSVRKLERQFLRKIGEWENVRCILQTQDPLLRKLPWHLWEVFDDHHIKPEVVISSEYKPDKVKLKSPVKILAIFGNNKDINIESDFHSLMEKLPDAIIEPLLQPSREDLLDKLWHQSWDILFFAGHSSSQADGSLGEIQINEKQTLPISDLRHSLKYAVQKGLKLAIFNSCDGLGLAHNLSDLRIPYMIVMREPVPDIVAQSFLRYFLTFFASGESLYTSVQHSRVRLQEELETEYPCASWIPVIFQNPAASVLKYPKYRYVHKIIFKSSMMTGLIFLLMIIFGYCLEEFKFRQRFSEGEKVLIDSDVDFDKEAGVKALWWKKHQLAIKHFTDYLKDYPHDAEARIYLENAKIKNQPSVKIGVAVPTGSNPNVALEILRGVAQAQQEINNDGGIGEKFLKIQIANDDNQPKIAKKIASRFVESRDILAVVGHNSSDASVPASNIYQAGKLVMISPTSTSIQLTHGNNKTDGNYIYRSVISFAVIAENLVEYAKKAEKNNILICSDTKAADQSFEISFTNAMTSKGIKFMNDINCDFADSNFQSTEIVKQAIEKKVDAILLNPQVDRINKAFDIGKANKGEISLLGNPSLHTQKTLESGSFVNGMIMAVPWQAAVSPNQKFVENANRIWRNSSLITWRTATAFDATKIIADAIEKKGSKRKDIQDVLSRNFVFSGATGTVKFLHYGDRMGDRVGDAVLVQVQPDAERVGKYEFVYKGN